MGQGNPHRPDNDLNVTDEGTYTGYFEGDQGKGDLQTVSIDSTESAAGTSKCLKDVITLNASETFFR
jgi:hypothetical protein